MMVIIGRMAFLFVFAPILAVADVERVVIDIPEPTAWTGERVPFFVMLRASGTFDGSASFSLPDLDRGVIIKMGDPTVSSEELEDETWFVQRHEFALFSQQSGTVTIPSFEVRFSSRDGFTGPVHDHTKMVPAAQVTIQRPPGSEQIGFLITTDSLEIDETWDPRPGPAHVGDIFKRTIVQRADQMTGMALAPPPQTALTGIKIYTGDRQVQDDTDRGNFSGQRTDTLTYVVQEPGTHSLPAITYVWWNPKEKSLRSKTLPAVTFEVAATTAPLKKDPSRISPVGMAWLVMIAIVVGGCVWQRHRIMSGLRTVWNAWQTPSRVAARRLLRACHQNDAVVASHAWLAWWNQQRGDVALIDPLRDAATDLQRHCYGAITDDGWDGAAMAHAFRQQQAVGEARRKSSASHALPPLNPTD